MTKLTKLFAIAFGFAFISVASNAEESAQEPRVITIEQPAAAAQNIEINVRVRRRGGTAEEECADEDVVVDGSEPEPEERWSFDDYNQAKIARPTFDRKLADPFFQPTQGRVAFSLAADFAQTKHRFTVLDSFNVDNSLVNLQGQTLSWKGSQFLYKGGVSFGLTDALEVKAAAAFHNSRFTYYGRDVSQTTGLLTGGNITHNDDGFDSWGVGLGWRAYEDEDVIFRLSLEYRSWEKTDLIYANAMGGLKLGAAGSKVYVSAAGFFYNNDGNMYGFGIVDETGHGEFVIYEEDNKRPTYIEGTLGLFTVLTDEIHLDLNATFANLSWHNVASIGGQLAFQPVESFAIVAYGQYVVWDSAKGGQDLRLWSTAGAANPGVNAPQSRVHLEQPRQFVVGLGAKLYF
ncbi:MAG: hypothetical protein FWD33_01910 [Alphaproteobacteria bacterium]|nr:hypothetical protein [Alphaproteobacteria bacterium]